MSLTIESIYSTAYNQNEFAYAEVLVVAGADVNTNLFVGLTASQAIAANDSYSMDQAGNLYGSAVPSGVAFGAGDVICIVYNQEQGAAWMRVNNGAWIGGGSPQDGSSPTFTGLTGPYFIAVSIDAGANAAAEVIGRFKLSDFAFPVPSMAGSWSLQ